MVQLHLNLQFFSKGTVSTITERGLLVDTELESPLSLAAKMNRRLNDKRTWIYEDTCIVNNGNKFAFTGVIRGSGNRPINYITNDFYWFKENLNLSEWIYYITDLQTGMKYYEYPAFQKIKRPLAI